MRRDIKLITGMLATLAGMLLTAYAAFTIPPAYLGAPSSAKLEVGLVLVAFGSCLWFYAHHANHSQEQPVELESMHD